MYRHRFDLSSAAAALLFLGIAARYASEGLGGPKVSYVWAVPGVFAALGVIGVLRAMFRSRRREP